jgi:L-seryl-tRNA(Ser) seleniumtransferase
MHSTTPLAELPAVYQILEHPGVAALNERVIHDQLVKEIQACLEKHRQELHKGKCKVPPSVEDIASEVAASVDEWFKPHLCSVINLTGTLLHTNLGRAPLSPAAIDAMVNASAAVNLEFDLVKGRRGDRDDLVNKLLCRLSGAEASTVVNNNAAAVYLALNSLANRRRVVISRGELVEIGGSFRMPDIVKKSGCKLVEVGTTNRTHLKDYRAALDEGGQLLLRVHTSNYKVVGFTHEVPLEQLVELGREYDVPVVVDLGSGALVDPERWGLHGEPTVQEAVNAGADLITFSGDKLLGGPQSGIAVGKAKWIKRLKQNPMKRALRCDKLILAALEATLREYQSPQTVEQNLPACRLISRSLEDIEQLAVIVLPCVERWAKDRARVELVDGKSQVGSGALPDATLPTRLIALTPFKGSPQTLARALRELKPPVIGRVHKGQVLLDLRGLLEAALLIKALECDKGDGQ